MSISVSDPVFALREALLSDLRNARWRPGQRLPTERRMSEIHAVGRSTVRRALTELKALGLITQRVGSGTFVTADAADKLPIASMPGIGVSPSDLMEARLVFEPGLVDLVVRNGTTADFIALEACCREADAAVTLQSFEHWDGAFHHALAEATHNTFMVGVSNLITKVRDQGNWGLLKKKSATPDRRAAYQRDHWSVLSALRHRDAATARQGLIRHLTQVRRNMFDHPADTATEPAN